MEKQEARTHYDNLQVSRTANSIVIRASYKALLQKYHPDKYPDRSEAERISRILNHAYEVLSDRERRAEYDRCLEERASGDAASDRLQQTDSRSTSPPAPSPASAPSPTPPPSSASPPTGIEPRRGMRWATWCIYVRYPVGGLVCFARFSEESPGSLFFLLLGVLCFSTAWQLLRATRLGWRLNWCLLIVETSTLVAVNEPDAAKAIVGLLFYFLPQAIYWWKRKLEFSSISGGEFRADWRQGWIVALPFVIAILAAISLPAYQDYVNRSYETRSKTVLKSTNPFTEAGQSQDGGQNHLVPRSPASPNSEDGESKTSAESEPPLKLFYNDPPKTQVEKQALQELLAARTKSWYSIYPFLDAQSAQANQEAIDRVIARRNALYWSGENLIASLDRAIGEIAPQYAQTKIQYDGTPQPIDRRVKGVCPRGFYYDKGYDKCTDGTRSVAPNY